VTDTLAPLLKFDKEFSDIVDFKYVAWGNAHNTTTQGVQCQHGSNECSLNRVINCATHHYPDQAKWLPFVNCLESAPLRQMLEAVDECADKAGMDAGALHECAEGQQGEELEREAARQTDGLCPPHAYVPWVLVDGVPLGESFDALKLFICVAYTGNPKPAHCYDPPAAAASSAAAQLVLPGVGHVTRPTASA
jgi:interferon gamma-inducible protein 30